MKIFVTGANGFIGSHIVEKLAAKGYNVKALVRKNSNLQWIKNLPIEISYGEITNFASLCENLKKDVDIILHIAGATKGRTYNDYFNVNVASMKNLIDAIKFNNLRIKKFIYFSSIAAVGGVKFNRCITEDTIPNPVSWYGETKRKGEELILKCSKQFPVVILRLSAVYGPRDRDLLSYFKFFKYRLRLYWDGQISLCFVKDVVDATILAIETDLPSPSIFNISDGNCYTISEVSKVAEIILGYKTIPVKIPLKFLDLTAKIIHNLFSDMSIISPDKVKELKEPCWVCDISKARRELNFNPKYSIIAGLKETLNWYREVHWL
ncbi:MAG: NAD(P)-dependent oxidoreductase [candidate division WOR-3 bacterium]|nr:NAD(P)-dependent oxidoreductase [candidate division WOR-3 bacterium]MCX7757380.1 NAD(P)-dependent oxidoreductase [candidate division WOR-3 bacterium]MDW7987748.1 NAD(P)-dependent oxidoreductase [candidate division WOR-3 bacterium]